MLNLIQHIKERFEFYFLILVSSIIFFILFFSIDKGIDLTDEGLYLALAHPNQSNLYSQFNYNLFFKLFSNYFGVSFGLIGLRVIKIIILLLSFLACYPILEFFKVETKWRWMAFIALFSNFAYFGQSLSYNTLAFFFGTLTLVSGFFFYTKNEKVIWAILMGGSASMAFISKSTTGLMLFAVGFIFVMGFSSKRFHIILLLRNISFFILSFVSIQLFFSLLFFEYSFISTVLNGIELSNYNSTHNAKSIVLYSISAVRWMLVLVFSGFFLGKGLFIKNLNHKFIFLLFSLFLIFYFFNSHTRIDFFRGFDFSFLIISYFLIGYSFSSIIDITIEKYIFSFLVLTLPFIISFGSNSYHFKGGILYLYFLFLVLAILNGSSTKRGLEIIGSYFVLILLVIKIYMNVIQYPFKQPSILVEMEPFRYLDEKIINLPRDYVDYLNNLKFVFENHTKPNDPILGLYEMPGDILLAGRTNWINPCVWEEYQFQFYIKKELELKRRTGLSFLLHRDGDLFMLPTTSRILKLDSLNHPSFGKVYLSKVF